MLTSPRFGSVFADETLTALFVLWLENIFMLRFLFLLLVRADVVDAQDRVQGVFEATANTKAIILGEQGEKEGRGRARGERGI